MDESPRFALPRVIAYAARNTDAKTQIAIADTLAAWADALSCATRPPVEPIDRMLLPTRPPGTAHQSNARSIPLQARQDQHHRMDRGATTVQVGTDQ